MDLPLWRIVAAFYLIRERVNLRGLGDAGWHTGKYSSTSGTAFIASQVSKSRRTFDIYLISLR